jgi:hypothetical protein
MESGQNCPRAVTPVRFARCASSLTAGLSAIALAAQGFHSTFSLNGDDKLVAKVDTNGVALAAIQGQTRNSKRSCG